MSHGNADQLLFIFLGVWIVLGMASAAFFFFSKDASLKRKVWPPVAIGVGVLCLGFVWLVGFPAEAMYVAVPIVALLTFLNLRGTRFCDSCGKTLMSPNPLFRRESCPRCGSKLA